MLIKRKKNILKLFFMNGFIVSVILINDEEIKCKQTKKSQILII